MRLGWRVRVCVMLCAAMVATAASGFCFAVAWATTPSSDSVALVEQVADGEYSVEVSLQGGTGRASIASPTSLTVRDGRATLLVQWSSPHYDYMVVDGERYLPTNDEGNSTFLIPVTVLNEPFDVVADTTAMSQPHEIAYRIAVDAGSMRAVQGADQGEGQGAGPLSGLVLLPVAVAVLAVAVVVLQRHRLHDKNGS